MPNFIEDIIERDLAQGNVKSIITRFPPEPNGYLHIGHAKAICLNFTLAQKYNGKCNLRLDDTNPIKEDDEYVRAMINDIEWLGFKGDITYASDYFPIMYECAVKLIKKGLAYVDDITAEQLKEQRGTLTSVGIESVNRNRPIEESLKLFEDMKDGRIADGALVLRAKIDMASPNINMRDPVIYRVLTAHHYRQGDKWRIYPLYDYAHPIQDAVEKVTHSLCSLEFEDHRPLYDWVVNNCEFDPKPHQYEFARLNIARTIMSKRYLKKLVDDGFVDGWDDPRMPTLAGLRRRGYTPSSIRTFCERAGIAKSNSEIETGQLESCIREELNEQAPRAMAVLEPLELEITNRDNSFSEQLDFEYNINGERVTKKISFSNRLFIEQSDFSLNPPPKYHRLTLGGMVRLKSAYIIKCTDALRDKDGNIIKILAEIVEGTKSGLDEGKVKVKGVIHFVDAKNCIDGQAKLYDYLLLAGGQELDFNDRLNYNSLITKNIKLESSLGKALKGEAFQFLRCGYFVRDTKSDTIVFNRIVELKDSYKK